MTQPPGRGDPDPPQAPAVLRAAPGTVLAVWTSLSFAARMIRVAEALDGEPAVANHVVIVTHQDRAGRWIGIQGQPGGVGLADCTPFLADPRTRGNYGQPLGDPAQMTAFLASCAASLGIRYDWTGIAEDGLDALHLNDLAAAIDPLYRWPAGHGLMPGEVVCSSLAAWQYEHAGWAHPAPGRERTCTPADWWDWSDRRLWTQAGLPRLPVPDQAPRVILGS